MKSYDRIIKLHAQIHVLRVRHENNLIFVANIYFMIKSTNYTYLMMPVGKP